MNLNSYVYDELINRCEGVMDNEIFHSSRLINNEWYLAWERKLHHCVRLEGNDIVVAKDHILTWEVPEKKRIKVNALTSFDGLRFLNEILPLNGVKVGKGSVRLTKETSIPYPLLDGEVILDRHIRLLPALDLTVPWVESLGQLCELEEDDDGLVFTTTNGTCIKYANLMHDGDYIVIPPNTLFQSSHTLKPFESKEIVFRDAYTLFTKIPHAIPYYGGRHTWRGVRVESATLKG